MRRWLWLPVALACVGVVAWLGEARGEETWFDRERIVSNGWAYEQIPAGLGLREPREITGYAFGPGRTELALCGPVEQGSGLWVVAEEPVLTRASKLKELMRKQLHEVLTAAEEAFVESARTVYFNPATPRLLWTSPAGARLRGPIWWAPNGGALLVRAEQGDRSDLVAVDYVTGEATQITHGARVVDAAWSPTGKQFAYVLEEGNARTLHLQPFPGGEARQLGAGGYNLRWTADGKTLRWYDPTSAAKWREMEWEEERGSAMAVGSRPARPESASWSPEGRWCATLEGEPGEKRVMVYPVNSTSGEAAPLPGLEVQRLAGWSPDGNLLVILDERDLPFVINVDPPSKEETLVGHDFLGREEVVERRSLRAVLAGPTVETEAGDPAWTSDGEWLVCAVARKAKGGPKWMGETVAELGGNLLVSRVRREYVRLTPAEQVRYERAVVTQNTKNVAIALNMYLADYDAFPLSNEQDEMMATIEDYVRNSGMFMRPGSKDEVVVRWVFDPTKRLQDVEDAAREEAVIVDYHPDFYVVGYVDGHVETFDKKKR